MYSALREKADGHTVVGGDDGVDMDGFHLDRFSVRLRWEKKLRCRFILTVEH